MFCPVCRAEYVKGITLCPDCQSALVAELPGATDEAKFMPVWWGEDHRIFAEVCSAMGQKNIPIRAFRRDDYNPYRYSSAGFEVCVAPADRARAEEEIRDAKLSAEAWQELVDSGGLELPDASGLDSSDDPRFLPENWHPDDATAEVWSGADPEVAKMIEASLRENGIASRIEPGEEPEDRTSQAVLERKVYVRPDDARRAKDIVREIVEAAPPQ